MKPRTRARGIALQVLYETDIANNHLPGDVLKMRLEEIPLADDLAEFARQIIFGVLPLTQDLDQMIAKYAPEWPLDQIAAIDRNILRIAFWEFAVSRETPVKVAINEAVELAKLYGSDSAPRFVNGVLGTLVEHENEIHQIIKNRITLDTKLET
ncbi:MAG: transcription antitermination factor NusB [Chloroflexi bacterium]|jgi:N utilization substance protein B|nr:transcription antitermination factor NusB [Chloroflexota bacterium]